MTADDDWADKLKTLRNYCLVVSLDKLTPIAVFNYLKKNCIEKSGAGSRYCCSESN